MTTLYSLRTHVTDSATSQYFISKFVDGEVESAYVTSLHECACPAGHRPSCRHRQMLPMMLAHGIVNTHWFWDFDLHRVVDFSGMLKSNLDALNELAAIPGVQVLSLDDPAALHNAIADAVGEAQHVEAASAPECVRPKSTPWRRL